MCVSAVLLAREDNDEADIVASIMWNLFGHLQSKQIDISNLILVGSQDVIRIVKDCLSENAGDSVIL